MQFKKIMIHLGILIIGLICVGCSQKATPEVTKATKVAEEMVTAANNQDYDTIDKNLSSAFLAQISMADFQKQLEPVIEKAGALESIEKSQGQEKDGVYAVQVATKQKNGSFTYTLQLDTDYKITGFFIK